MEKKEKKPLNYAGFLGAVILLMAVATIVGVIFSISSNKKVKENALITAYNNQAMEFTIRADGVYIEESPIFCVAFDVEKDDVNVVVNTLKDYSWAKKVEKLALMNGKTRISILTTNVTATKNWVNNNGYDYTVSYDRAEGSVSFAQAYNNAYNTAVNRANRIAVDTGQTWRLKKCEMLSENFNRETAETRVSIAMTFNAIVQ